MKNKKLITKKLQSSFNSTFVYKIKISNVPEPVQHEVNALLEKLRELSDFVGAKAKIEVSND
jgi:hypothetical protein